MCTPRKKRGKELGHGKDRHEHTAKKRFTSMAKDSARQWTKTVHVKDWKHGNSVRHCRVAGTHVNAAFVVLPFAVHHMAFFFVLLSILFHLILILIFQLVLLFVDYLLALLTHTFCNTASTLHLHPPHISGFWINPHFGESAKCYRPNARKVTPGSCFCTITPSTTLSHIS
jgi:hypothetical protein